MLQNYDVVVVGGGHAGCEAALAAAKMGASTLLVTMNMNTIAQMSCNPAMGGVAKGQILREIDALGGGGGIVSDKSAIQFRMLNMSKGPAMWSPRTQNDRMRFAEEWRLLLESTPNLDFWQDTGVSFTTKNGRIHSLITSIGIEIICKTLILTNGTFLNGKIHLGLKNFGGGRAGERGVTGLTECLVEHGFEHGRMKTGTPPRVDGRSLNYDAFEEQPGDENPGQFSHWGDYKLKKQIPCHITYTNPTTHEILKSGFDRSPMFNGAIESSGPRYCPSVEEKINRFSDRDRHQIFVEPEGWNTVEIYVNGFSTSLPEEVQIKALKTVPGFEDVKMFRPGYAIEYDYFPPTQLNHTMETKLVENLFLAGQINGTTGYEEAGCQGMMAGINAACKVQNREPFILHRNESYIGVLIDDLITKGTKEPYRMFTSRAEHRILLRQDNADLRLSPKAFELGLINQQQLEKVQQKQYNTEQGKKILRKVGIRPEQINHYISSIKGHEIKQQIKAVDLLKRPYLNLKSLVDHSEELKEDLFQMKDFSDDHLFQIEIQTKYKGYIDREFDVAEKMTRLENLKIPDTIDYKKVKSISSEASEKLSQIKPKTIGQASRISGISPSDINVLLIYLGR